MNKFMKEAIIEAKKAEKRGEVPIGAVIVKGEKIVSRGYNRREKSKNALHHAEIIAINKACKKLKDWRLTGCTLYVTLEPCPMCSGAIVNSRLDKVVYGAKDKTSDDNLFEKIVTSNRLNHKTEYEFLPDYEQECSSLLTNFFKNRRK